MHGAYLSTECEFISQITDVIVGIHEEDETLVEGVILTFHVQMPVIYIQQHERDNLNRCTSIQNSRKIITIIYMMILHAHQLHVLLECISCQQYSSYIICHIKEPNDDKL